MKTISLEFEKYQGSGNDFVLIDEDRNQGITEDVRIVLSRTLMDRHLSVGADSVLFIKQENAGTRYRVYEEGLELEMCGNGLHCAADYLLTAGNPKSRVFITKGNVFRTVIRSNHQYMADLGCLQPVGRYLRWKVEDSLRMVGLTTLLPGKTPAAILKGMGISIDRGFFVNPSEAHVVFLVKNISAIDLNRLGEYIAGRTKVFSESANVNICERVNQRAIRIRTYERGKFKETLACGTGSAASAYVAKAIFKLRGNTICVKNTGGDLWVRFCDGKIFLAGPAVKVFHGTIRVKLPAASLLREG